jgi:tetratricopeptide (TPR) repeat protein
MITLRTALQSPHRPRPTRVRAAGILAAAVAIVAATYLAGWATRSSTSASTSPQPGRVDAFAFQPGAADAAPDDLANIDEQLRIWVPKAAADARDDISAGNVALLYLGRGRLTGDAADYERALTAANRAVDAYPASTGTRALKATVLQATHDFTGALALAEAILREEPQNVDALAVAGDARLELGRLDEAAATYAKIAAIMPGPALDAREARLAWLTGDATEAMRLATRARDGAEESTTSDPSFYEAQLGEMARLTGDATTARSAFDAALKIRPANQLALLGSARLDAAAGDDTAAIAAFQTAAAIAPRPETLGLLADLLTATGDAKGAAQAADTINVIDRLGGTSAQLFDRQILAFDLDHGGASRAVLDRAVAAADIRPDAAGLDLVAWAAYRLGDLTTARSERARAMATGTIDARILYHAGAIGIADGDDAGGRALLRRALDLGPALDPIDRAGVEALLRP